jgi:hypothetical protein
LGLAFTGCPAPAGNPAGDLGDTFTLSGELKKETYKYDGGGPPSYSYDASPITTGKVVASTGEEGAITNGKFSIDIKVPTTGLATLTKEEIETELEAGDYYDSIAIAPAGVKYVRLFLTVGSEDLNNRKNSISGNDENQEAVYYMYVDADVKLTFKGREYGQWAGSYHYNIKTNDATLEFKKGWNALYWSTEEKSSEASASYTTSLSLSAKTLEWVVGYYSYY